MTSFNALLVLLLAALLLAGCINPMDGGLRADANQSIPLFKMPNFVCTADKNCDDGKRESKDVCDQGTGKCSNQLIIDCLAGDDYCPPMCGQENDPDCECASGNNYCPHSCTAENDSDCGGSAQPSGGQPIEPQKDECSDASDCNDNDYSTEDACGGSPKKCVNTKITTCKEGDGYCPEGCNYSSDRDCEPIDLCQTDTDCEDGLDETADFCRGEPKECHHKVVKDCIHSDGICPLYCEPEEDNDCLDQCQEAEDCDDRNDLTIDECSGRVKKCRYTEITECKSDGVCPPFCDASTDSDCACASGNNYCPPGCKYKEDDDCPQRDECRRDDDCNDGKNFTLDFCIGTPTECIHRFLDGADCGDVVLGQEIGDYPSECFCWAINECKASRLGVSWPNNLGRVDFGAKHLKAGNCVIELFPKTWDGTALSGALINYETACETIDSGMPAQVSPLRSSSRLEGEACKNALTAFLNRFPDALIGQGNECRGNFVEFYADWNSGA